MKKLAFDYAFCGLDQKELSMITNQLHTTIQTIVACKNQWLDTQYAFLALPNDDRLHTQILSLTAHKKKLNPTMLIIIGIGGSNLGTRAVHEMIRGILYNSLEMVPKVYYADTVDSDYIFVLLMLAEKELCAGNNILLNVVSKSGETFETVTNFNLFLALLKKYTCDKYAQYIVITSDTGSALHAWAKDHHAAFLAIPHKVGGRYSVLSSVGLFPLALLGIDIHSLCTGAASIIDDCLVFDMTHNYALISAAITFMHYKLGKQIHDFFIFSVDGTSLGNWLRQLTAESLGKKYDRENKLVHVGITPTVSIGTTDLHSVAQLYLAGPNNRLTSFVTIQNNRTEVMLNDTLKTPSSHTMQDVKQAIIEGTMSTYKKASRPFMTIAFPEKSEYYVGQFLQWKMIETVYLGALLNINPFDQPDVEIYKREAEKLL